jgi:hypothetical protein
VNWVLDVDVRGFFDSTDGELAGKPADLEPTALA